ncbi:DNA-dependent protein kinase catalytic subunit-like isoform X1 [Dermacentor albipictus]|uniref:DNA-dependent protein kinase catalytic subunit-like isoform X1 n=1 Tax=Dermacentor albipictus TaxID=60249 RepID=UPI0038FC4072
MTEQIREALLKLHASERPDEALTLVDEVDRTCQDQAFSDKDEGYITTLLVSDEKSLVSFLKRSIVSEQLKDAKAKGLQLLTGWFEKVPSHLFSHAMVVKDVGTQLAFRDKTAKVRCAALVLLSKVLESCQGLDIGEKLDIPSLIDRFFILLSQPSKMTPTVKVEVLCVLGIIAEHHPAAANPYSDKLLSLYLGELKQLRKTGAGKERTALAGCLQGLSGYLHSFGTGFESEPDDYFLLFKFMKDALVPNPATTRYDVPRAALILLSKHAALFGQLLLDEYKSLYKQIGHWSRHSNRDMKWLGVAALESFLREVAAALAEGKDRKDHLNIFEYFIQEFQKTLRSETNTHNLAAALKGYGLLALPCKQYLKESDVLFMLSDVLLRSEHVFQSISSPAVLEDSLPLLTSFQEATASILRCATKVPESQLLLVEKLAVLQIENFPLVAENMRVHYVKSLLFLLLAVHPLSPTSLSQIVYQGLARTCSHPIVADVEASEEEDAFTGKFRTITYRRYNMLWHYLLEAVNVQELNAMQVTADARSTFVCNLYDALLSAILSMVSKLNLSVKQSNAETETGTNMSDPTCGVDAECPKDFNIFINLVDFFRDTFLWKRTELFTKWAFVMIKKFVEYSTRCPLVSGFYKALAVCFQICEKSSYFESGSNEAKTCLCLVSSFVQETMGRLQQFKDDLLASCLELVLRAPSPTAQEQAITRVPALKMALQQGLSFLPLAKSTLDTLQLWERRLPADMADSCLRKVLPGLCPYLSLGTRSGLFMDPSEDIKRPRPRGPHKIPLKMLYKKKREHETLQETELETLRRKILDFLGSLDGERRAFLMADLEKETLAAALTWDPETREHLLFAMPFPDAKIDIAFDGFLPRVVELARFAGNRQTKVAACELLHALVLYAVGTGVQNTERRAKCPMVHLYKHLFPELLHLSCDADQVAQNLFRPLTLQLTHWFSSKSTRGSQESVAIIECLWDTVTQSQETTVRDFAAQCLKEFMAWSIKQSSPKELEKSPTNVQSVLRRLCSYCRHPSASKRLGAALVFNNIYVLLREEESLVDVFILETLAYFVDSLKLAHADEKTIGTRELCCRALDKILRIVSAKSSLLSSAKSKRRWPFDVEKKPVTLSLAVEWLLFQTSCPQSDCRHKCMELVWALVPRLPGAPTHSSYVAQLLKANGDSFFLERFEEGLSATSGTWTNLTGIRKFCDHLLGLLECYTWILEQRLLEPRLLFEVSGKPSSIFSLVTKFLEQLALCENLHEALGNEETASLLCTPTGTSALNVARCSLTVRLFNFLTVWMKTAPTSMSSVPDAFWKTEAFWKCCVVCVLLPSEAGFDLADLEVANQLPHEMLGFLKQAATAFPDLLSSSFSLALGDFLAKHPECTLEKVLELKLSELSHPSETLDLSQADLEPMDEDTEPWQNDMLRLMGLVSGYRLLAELKIVKAGPEKAMAPVCAVAEFFGERAVSPTPLFKDLCLRLLELATSLGASASSILQSLEPTRAWNVMGDQLCQLFVENAETFVPAALKLTSSATGHLTQVLSHVLQDKQLVSLYGSTLSSEVMKHWPSLACFFKEDSPQTAVNSAVLVLEKLVHVSPEQIAIPKSPHFETLFTILLKLLERPGATLVDKVLALGLLPAFATDTRQETCDRLRDALENMVLQHFPMEVSKLLPGAPELLSYTQAMRKLLAGLESTGSTVLLELLLRVLYREDKSHFLEHEVLLSLRRTMPRCTEAKQQQLLTTAYKCAATLHGLPTSARLSIASKLLPQLLRHSSKSSLRQFFVDNVTAIVDTVASKIRSGSEWELASKVVALSCLEVLYSCSHKDDVSGKQSAINNAFCRTRGVATTVGNELTKEVTKHTNVLKKERGELGSSEVDAGLWRHLRCAAYNVIASVVSCTQVEAQFYDVFLFQEKPEKGEFVWNNITDEQKRYTFPLELEAPFQRSRQVVGVTEEAQEDGSIRRSSGRRSLSSSLQGSSLAREASQYSLSAGGLAFWDVDEQSKSTDSGAEKAPEDDTRKFRKLKVVDLEDDELNQHECMAAVCSVIDHMASIGIICKTVEEAKASPVPKWLSTITGAVTGAHITPNALRFLCRVIVNCAEVLKVYAHHLLPVMLNVMAQQKLGSELDAFVIDLVVTALTWTADIDAKDLEGLGVGQQAQSVLEFLVTHCGHQRRDILRTQLELVQAWVGTWKKHLRFPADTILQLLDEISLDSKDVKGVLLFGIFVTNDLVDLEIQDYTLGRILERLPKLLATKYRLSYTSVADVIGLTFRKMNEGVGIDSTFGSSVESNLNAILRMCQRDQHVLCLHHICRFYEPFAQRFTETMMLQLPRALASFKVAILEVISMACTQVDQPVRKLEGLGFIDMLAHGDEALQKVSLEICAKLPAVATQDDWHILLPIVCKLQSHASTSCRKLVYDVCMRLYTKYRSDKDAANLMKQARRVLLLGLGDADLPLRLSVANFWCQETQLPRATTERLVALLGDMYLPEMEEQFLSSATFLLLELTSRSPDYDRKVFQHPLSDCTFVDYTVTGSWRRRHAAMTPLFAETLSFSQTQSSTQSSTADGSTSQKLRATQATLQFTPTQQAAAAGETSTYSWLTQSTHEPSLPVQQKQQRSATILQLSPGKAGPSAQHRGTASERVDSLRLLKRRFLRDDDQIRLQHMRREVRLKETRKKLKEERHARREAEVTLYRSYRMGDFPDIQISHAALIAPMQALAQQDQQVAQMLLSGVVTSVLHESRRDGASHSRQRQELCQGLQRALAGILEGSMRCFPPLVAFVQEVAFQSASDLKLPVAAISRASIASGHQSLGILLLEEMNHANSLSASTKAPPAKRSKKEDHPEQQMWIQLAELYKSLGDFDAVRASLALCEDVGPEARKALEKEAQGDFQQARDIYRQLAESRPPGADGFTWDDAILQCCCLLGEWGELQSEIDARLEQSSASKWDSLWDGGYRQEHYLPLYVKARVKSILGEYDDQRDFPRVIREWMEDSSKNRFLEEECCQELALLSLSQKDTGRADYYVKCLTEQFLEDWSSLSVLTPTLIEGKLECLLPLTDLALYLKHSKRHDADNLLSSWRSRLPSNADSVLLWNEIITNRCFLIKSLGQPVPKEKALLLNAFANAMLQQENVPTALRSVVEIEQMRLSGQLGDWADWRYVETYCKMLRKASENEPLPKQVAAYMRMLEKVDAAAGGMVVDIVHSVKYKMLRGQLMSGLSLVLRAGGQMTEDQKAALKLSNDNQAITAQSVCDEALHQHLAATAVEEASPELKADAHLTLAVFCSGILQAEESGEPSLRRRDECPQILVDAVLTAMRLGHGQAPDMFPQLLQLLQHHPSCGEAFIAQCSKVPCWMFLRWINQILALLDKQVGPFLFDIVDSVAHHYPNALIYPFRVSSSAYTFECPKTRKACQNFVGRLQQAMDKVPLVNEFIKALELLQFPDIAFKDWYESVKDALNEKQGPASIKELFKKIVSQLLVCSRDSSSRSSWSRVYQRFSEKMREKVIDTFGAQGEKLAAMTPKKFQEQYNKIMSGYKAGEPPKALKDISPWLSHFSSLNQEHSLEIPGQYTGKGRPMPEYHVKVFGFDESIRVLQSKQRPCRITIRGDDEKEYRFLVKTGEDLRQDDRIEQIFKVMNDLLQKDPVCRSKHLQLVTYSVVPLTHRVGLIQWLDDTMVLEEFLRQGLTTEELEDINRVPSSYKLHSVDDYMKAYETQSCQKAALSRYHGCLRPASKQALRKALLGLSSCPEAFFALRSRFICSHATISIAQWVLGIGDRHLGNFLVGTKTGLEIGIDFGYAFGVATQFLPVPELMPFRLTAMYTALVEPFDKAGTMACAMHYTLQALRSGSRSLLDMMDVFVQEPTIDWLRFAKRQSQLNKEQKGEKSGKSAASLDWYPRQKVDIVRQKLEGRHPSYILRDELKLGKGKNSNFGNMERICLGADGPHGVIRRQFSGTDKLTSQQQVECLIEQATDPAILGLTWKGWQPWR